jgi:hypothetical protein
MAKSAGECFLCGEEGKGKRITFYSGARKGGSRTELLTATVTVHEWWKDLTLHEILVCRACQDRLWAQQKDWTPLLCGVGAAVFLVLAVPCAFFGLIGLVLAGVLLVAALAAGGAAVWLHLQGKPKPTRALLDPLLVKEAMMLLPDEGRTFLTNDQYIDLVDRGIIG